MPSQRRRVQTHLQDAQILAVFAAALAATALAATTLVAAALATAALALAVAICVSLLIVTGGRPVFYCTGFAMCLRWVKLD